VRLSTDNAFLRTTLYLRRHKVKPEITGLVEFRMPQDRSGQLGALWMPVSGFEGVQVFLLISWRVWLARSKRCGEILSLKLTFMVAFFFQLLDSIGKQDVFFPFLFVGQGFSGQLIKRNIPEDVRL